MAISIDWGARIIHVPQADLTVIGGGLYELDVDAFRLLLKDLEDSEEGMAFPATHRHNTAVTLAGVTYARSVEIINEYTVTFEDGPYRVRFAGANHNIGDVTNVNQVSLLIQNSAGLIQVAAGGGGGSSGPTAAAIAAEVWAHATGQLLRRLTANRRKLDKTTGLLTIYADDNVTPLYVVPVYSDTAGTVPYDGTSPIHSQGRIG